MAKRRKKRKQTSLPPPSRSPSDRHDFHVVKADPIIITHPPQVRHKPDLRPVEDLRRTPHDLENSAFRTRSGRPARTVTRPPDKVQERRVPSQVHTYFQNPERVLVCIRRDDRRRSLFALQHIGKGKTVTRERTYTEKSYLRCK